MTQKTKLNALNIELLQSQSTRMWTTRTQTAKSRIIDIRDHLIEPQPSSYESVSSKNVAEIREY